MTATAPEPQTTHQISATTQRIVLTGFMGAGKTTVGRLLAELLGWNFVDLDQHLEARAGATVPELFATHGEPHFRRLESSALASALSLVHTVVALGGGVPEQLTNRLLLEQTPGTLVVFLEAPFPLLYDRCMLQSFSSPQHARPLLDDAAAAAERFTRRQPLYRRLARLSLDVSELTPAAAARTLLGRMPK